MGNGDPSRTVRTPSRYWETPQALGASLGPTNYQGTTFSRNVDFFVPNPAAQIFSTARTVHMHGRFPGLGQDVTSQIPASLVQSRSPSLLRRYHEIGDGSPTVRIVRHLEVEAESLAVAHHVSERS